MHYNALALCVVREKNNKIAKSPPGDATYSTVITEIELEAASNYVACSFIRSNDHSRWCHARFD